jgi:hypothetical protein
MAHPKPFALVFSLATDQNGEEGRPFSPTLQANININKIHTRAIKSNKNTFAKTHTHNKIQIKRIHHIK